MGKVVAEQDMRGSKKVEEKEVVQRQGGHRERVRDRINPNIMSINKFELFYYKYK